MMDSDMGSMMGWMMGFGLLGWIVVIVLLVAILVVLIRIAASLGSKDRAAGAPPQDGPEIDSRRSRPPSAPSQ
jgi:uncharacterized membrane protein